MSSLLERVTPLLITHDEAANISRTLDALAWAREIVVVDSGSTDGTLEILAARPGVRVLSRRFDSFARQCAFGLREGGITGDWVLSLDADHVLTAELVAELSRLEPDAQVGGYEVCFTYCVHGRPLHGSLYPPRVVLFRREGGEYVDDGHGHFVRVAGKVERLRGRILHDDRKPLWRWLAAQDRYMRIEAAKLHSSSWRALGAADRVRRMVVVAPLLAPLWCLIVKRGLLDGWPGWYYALQRGIAEGILALRLVEARLGIEEAGG